MLNPINLYISILISLGMGSSFFLDGHPQLKAPLLTNSFTPTSPFTTEYGIYSLSEAGHNNYDLLETIAKQTYYKDGEFIVKAPYTVYRNESTRFYHGVSTNTITGEATYEGNYDLWNEPYNRQPSMRLNMRCLLDGYNQGSRVRSISINHDGNLNKDSELNYQNAHLITSDSLEGISYAKMLFYSYSYAEGITTTTEVENRDVYLEGDTYTRTATYSENRYLGPAFNFEYEISFTLDDYYYVDSVTATASIPSALLNTSVTHEGNTWTVNYLFRNNRGPGYVPINYTTSQVIKRDNGYQSVPFNITKPSEPTLYNYSTISLPTISTTTIDWFGSYFLKTINCSGSGGINDKNLVESKWNEVETYYLNLPEYNRNRIRNPSNNLDEDLNAALERYDYIVFKKGYNVNDFLNRRSLVNYSYRGNFINSIMEKDITTFIIVIASSISVISLTVLLVIYYKKKRVNLKE